MTAPYRSLVLGFHPTARGFGWVAFEHPLSIVDHGLVDRKGPFKNPECLKRLAVVLERLKPETLVIEDFSGRSKRVRNLCLAVLTLAHERNVEVAVVSRGEVSAAFAAVGATTRNQIAAATLRHLPALSPYYPGNRKFWESEDRRLAIFTAAALVLTYYHVGTTRLAEELREGT